jgi:hypothetical protein
MKRKLVLALAVMSALGIASSGAFAQSDEEKQEKKPEQSLVILEQGQASRPLIVADDEKKETTKPELVADEDKKDKPKPELIAESDDNYPKGSTPELIAEGDDNFPKGSSTPELIG